MFNTGDVLDKDQVQFRTEAMTEPHIVVPPEVSRFTQTEVVSIQAVNRVMLAGWEPEAKPQDEPLFGTHIREAVATVKKLLGKP